MRLNQYDNLISNLHTCFYFIIFRISIQVIIIHFNHHLVIHVIQHQPMVHRTISIQQHQLKIHKDIQLNRYHHLFSVEDESSFL